jgi:hypothetical protein
MAIIIAHIIIYYYGIKNKIKNVCRKSFFKLSYYGEFLLSERAEQLLYELLFHSTKSIFFQNSRNYLNKTNFNCLVSIEEF